LLQQKFAVKHRFRSQSTVGKGWEEAHLEIACLREGGITEGMGKCPNAADDFGG